MMPDRALVSRLSAVTLMTCLAATAPALELEVEAEIINPVVSGSPALLLYDLSGYHETKVISYFPAEGLSPLLHQGFFHKIVGLNKGLYDSCSKSTFVLNSFAICHTHILASCPGVDGVWRTTSRGAALTQVKNGFSGDYYANCLPLQPETPDCSVEYPLTQLVVVELDSGRTSQPSPIRGHALSRVEERQGKSYFFDEWALVDVPPAAGRAAAARPPAVAVHAASSARGRERAGSYAQRVLDQFDRQAVGRYLVIEEPRHLRNGPSPLVRLDSLSRGETLGGELVEGKVLFRAELNPHGDLDRVEVILGDQETAQTLAADLSVEHPSGSHGARPGEHGHRTTVFAAFEVVEDQPQLVAVIPLYPRCCCPMNCDDPFDPPQLNASRDPTREPSERDGGAPVVADRR